MTEWKICQDELYAFIGILLLRGLIAKGVPQKELWNKKWDPPIFGLTMSRDRFRSILKYLRFDNKSTRRRRLNSKLYQKKLV